MCGATTTFTGSLTQWSRAGFFGSGPRVRTPVESPHSFDFFEQFAMIRTPYLRRGSAILYLLCLSNGTAPCTVDPETCLIKVILLKHGTDTGTFASASRAKDN